MSTGGEHWKDDPGKVTLRGSSRKVSTRRVTRKGQHQRVNRKVPDQHRRVRPGRSDLEGHPEGPRVTSACPEPQHPGQGLLGAGVDEVRAGSRAEGLPVSAAERGQAVHRHETLVPLPPAGQHREHGARRGGGLPCGHPGPPGPVSSPGLCVSVCPSCGRQQWLGASGDTTGRAPESEGTVTRVPTELHL